MSWPACIGETADWFGTLPIEDKDFETWWGTFWPEYMRRCRGMAVNIYVQYKLKEVYVASLIPDMGWEESFNHEAFRHAVEEVHAEVGQDTVFFYEVCLPHFRTMCRPMFDAAGQ